MKCIMCILLAALFLYGVSLGGQPDSLWRGVYLGGEIENINYDTLKHTLHLNLVEGATGWGRGDISMLTNSAGVKVLNENATLEALSRAQRMGYEAEQSKDPLKNYFRDRHPEMQIIFETSTDTTVSLRLGVGAQSGFMVKSPVPNNEYHYDRTEWMATFRLKVDAPVSLGDSVVQCIVRCASSGRELKDSVIRWNPGWGVGTYKDFVVPFTVPSSVLAASRMGTTSIPTGGIGEPTARREPCMGVELQVYWYGDVTTYLDNVVVEDTLAHSLFAGKYDRVIRDTAAQYAAYGLHEMFYLRDEPFMSAYLSHNYVSNQIKDALGQNDLRARTTAAVNERFARFLTDAQPANLMIDPYPFISYIPHPSIMNKKLSDRSGIEWNNDGSSQWGYNDYVRRSQDHLNQQIEMQFRPGADAAKQGNKPLILVPQLHGVAYQTTGKYRRDTTYWESFDLRPPSAAELRVQYNLGIAYGAKGFAGWDFRTGRTYYFNGQDQKYPGLVSEQLHNGYFTDHSSDSAAIWGTQVIWTGHREKWDEFAAINERLAHIGDTLMALNWHSARTWMDTRAGHTRDWVNIVDTVTTKDTLGNIDAHPYVDVGRLQRDGTDYIVVVNRRCCTRSDHVETRDITLTFNIGTGNLLVTDIESNRAWVTKGNGTFSDRFQPGEGKIYRLTLQL